jgi:hypothetical protein
MPAISPLSAVSSNRSLSQPHHEQAFERKDDIWIPRADVLARETGHPPATDEEMLVINERYQALEKGF